MSNYFTPCILDQSEVPTGSFISTSLNCTAENVKPCTDGVHVQSEMNAEGTIGGHGMGGGNTTASLLTNRLRVSEHNSKKLAEAAFKSVEQLSRMCLSLRY